MFIVSHLSQTLFCFHLLCNLLMGIFFTLFPEFSGRNFLAVHTELLNSVFNRQTVGIPTWEKRRVIAFHRL